VSRFPSFLDRFRRLLAPPGRPAQALGVPASGQDLEAELGPVLGALDTVSEQASEIRQQAHERAGRLRQDAAREAAVLLEQARGHADAERARAAAEQRAQAQRDGAEARAAAQREAEQIRGRGEERVAVVLAEVLECVRRSGR
jgi:hypothetical protein